MVQCQRCLLPQGHFGVKLDKNGICNLCKYYDQYGEKYIYVDNLQDQLKERINLFKGKYDYDAVVGLSGGMSSTYVLYTLVHDYGLNILAMTYDNGFLSDFAKEGIDEIVKKMGVDHIYCEPDWRAMRLHYKATLNKHAWPCLACVSVGYTLAIKLAYEKKIPFCVNGRSPYQLLRNFSRWSKDPTIELININRENHSFKRLTQYYKKMNRMTRLWLLGLYQNGKDRKLVYNKIFKPEISSDFAPELINYFLFESYDEQKMKQFLEEKIGYQRPDNDLPLGHGDCYIHDAMAYLFTKKHQVSMPALKLAVMIRSGHVAKAEGEKILKLSEPDKEYLEEAVDYFCERVKLDRHGFYVVATDKQKRKRNFWGH